MTDGRLIEKFLDGDTNAFNTLIWRWEKPLYNFVYRTVGEKETSKDICQIAFIRMYKQLNTLRDRDKFSSWLYRIALNLCRDEMKKKKRQAKTYWDDLCADDGTTDTLAQMEDQQTKQPDELCHQNHISDILKNALMVLPEEQRIVIVMKQYQGLKFTEIADILKEPVNTVKSRLYYGLRKLRKILEESKLSKEVLLNEM
ncbi:MAG: sigma-70 family RNA polymerase sigma factor [Deltaproteobacteria bacterium]|nr:sigma-70 family RNA polymerase sigma factor [Deltaproteobacteria bacterium]